MSQEREEKTHELKIWPEFFQAVVLGKKKHEVRINDRDYQVGDMLVLKEFNPESNAFTGNQHCVDVTYITYGGKWGLPEGMCIMSIEDEK